MFPRARNAPAQGPNHLLLGARWDQGSQNERMTAAHLAGLIDYVEVNYPISAGDEPSFSSVPIFVHCPVNPLASPYGYNKKLAALMREAAERHDSPWVGEHLCWAGPEEEGRLGYIVTPLLCEATVTVAAQNVRELQSYYGRPVGLELAPVYSISGELESEMEFLGLVAEAADARILLDIAHWTASNRNMGRAVDHGLDAIDASRIIEPQVAGIRRGRSSPFWHDSHGDVPEDVIIELTEHLIALSTNLRAVTFEHSPSAPQEAFFGTLERLREIVPRTVG